MYTNELLEEKYKAQRKLLKQAKIKNKDYFEFINDKVQKLFDEKGWKMNFSKKM